MTLLGGYVLGDARAVFPGTLALSVDGARVGDPGDVAHRDRARRLCALGARAHSHLYNTTPTEPNNSMPSRDGGWASAPPSQVIRTVAFALLTTAVVLGAFFLLWQVRTFVGWFVIVLFLAAVLT